jgi:hypothetical protein
MVAVKGDGVKGGAVKGASEGWRSEGCDTRQPTHTDRPFIHYWALVWSSSPMSLAGTRHPKNLLGIDWEWW